MSLILNRLPPSHVMDLSPSRVTEPFPDRATEPLALYMTLVEERRISFEELQKGRLVLTFTDMEGRRRIESLHFIALSNSTEGPFFIPNYQYKLKIQVYSEKEVMLSASQSEVVFLPVPGVKDQICNRDNLDLLIIEDGDAAFIQANGAYFPLDTKITLKRGGVVRFETGSINLRIEGKHEHV